MRVLISGAGGLLGSKLAEVAIGAGHTVFSGYSSAPPTLGTPVRLDLTDPISIKSSLEASAPDVVFHCAALTDVDRCETEKELAMRINAEGAEQFAKLASETGPLFVYVSTDYVFDGSQGMYAENDQTNPVNFYGFTKLLGEKYALSCSKKALVARTSVIYGAAPSRGKVNFALWLTESLLSSKPVALLTDQWVSPTLNSSLARMLLEAAERGLTGVYHLAGASRVSRYEFGVALAEAFGFKPGSGKPGGEREPALKPAIMSEFSGKWVARRPRDSSLDVSKASSLLKEKPLPLGRAIEEFKKEYLQIKRGGVC
ncbi:MAG: dTDP-4-dehydrorhamnose reductase [Candidatus Methanosuratincola petrocarbonis]